MKTKTKTCMLVAIFASIALVGHVDVVEAGNNSWGWAKPLNQKPGSLLYTLNRKNHRNTASRKATFPQSYQLRTYSQAITNAPAHYPAVTVQPSPIVIQSTPTTQIRRQPILSNRVIHPPTQVVQPQVKKTPSALDGWLVP